MKVNIYFTDGRRKEIRNAYGIVKDDLNIFINVKQAWNESAAPDEPYVFKKEEIYLMLIDVK